MSVQMLCLGRHWNARHYVYEDVRSDVDGRPAPELPADAYSMHWCSSNHKQLAGGLTLENLGKSSPNPTLFHKLALEVIRKGI